MHASLLIVLVVACGLNCAIALPSMKSMPSQETRLGYFPPAEADYPPITPFPSPPSLPPSDEIDRLRTALEQRDEMNKDSSRRDAFVIDSKSMEAFNPPSDHKQYEKSDNKAKTNEFSSVGPITNPAAYYLQGTDFEKISSPKCRMLGCVGPLPNDGEIGLGNMPARQGETCEQTFVPLNGCVDGKGYPIGMLCNICCDCSADFITEMRNSRGYKENFQR